MSALQSSEIVKLVALTGISAVGVYIMIKYLDPTHRNKAQAREATNKIIKRLNSERSVKIKSDDFNEYEAVIASNLINHNDIDINWKDIAGIDSIIKEIKKTVITPIVRSDLIAQSVLSQPPKGVLLYGPPGCGKTMIAKAIAKESSLPFINLDISALTDKWYGESQKLATAVFSAAKKLSPCIIFIDEIESLLRSRNNTDHEATAMMKTQFMTHWDGLMTEQNSGVIIMGASNRPEDIDKAFLRRMPATFHIPLPNCEQRKKILNKILEKENYATNVDFNKLSNLTENYSGSDLRELCRTASLYRFSEVDQNSTSLRSISMSDFVAALRKLDDSERAA